MAFQSHPAPSPVAAALAVANMVAVIFIMAEIVVVCLFL